MNIPIADIDDIRIDKADDGNCHIRLGSSTFKASPKKLPDLAWRGETSSQDNNKVCTGLVFFNARAEDGKIIRDLLRPAASPANA